MTFFASVFFSLLRLVWDSWHRGNPPFTNLFDGFCGFYRLKGEIFLTSKKRTQTLNMLWCMHPCRLGSGSYHKGF
jgi:hypothetical protein